MLLENIVPNTCFVDVVSSQPTLYTKIATNEKKSCFVDMRRDCGRHLDGTVEQRAKGPVRLPRQPVGRVRRPGISHNQSTHPIHGHF